MMTIGTLPGERLAGLSADLFHKLQAGAISIDELALFNRRKNPFTPEVVEERLLERIGTANLAGITSFTVAKKFVVDETVDGIKVGWLGDNFKKHFLPKVEKGEVTAETLAINNLSKNAKDPAIITNLGGEPKVEISLGQFWEFLKTADRSFWYVAYVRDDQRVLWAVNADWPGDKLHVEAFSLDSPDGWRRGNRFLSR